MFVEWMLVLPRRERSVRRRKWGQREGFDFTEVGPGGSAVVRDRRDGVRAAKKPARNLCVCVCVCGMCPEIAVCMYVYMYVCMYVLCT